MSRKIYESELRADQARLTRQRILDAAEGLLLADGYQAMTIAALAAAAGVSAQTVYNAIGGKAMVVKALYDVRLAGDDEDVPMRDRPELIAVYRATSAPGMLRAYAAAARLLAERVGPLLAAIGAAGSGDNIESFASTIDAERLVGAEMLVRSLDERFGLPDGVNREQATDVVWTMISPAVFDLLVGRREWTMDAYESWLSDTLRQQLVRRTRHRTTGSQDAIGLAT